jgi:glycosyltransferase involved in cell wall biosynthesis
MYIFNLSNQLGQGPLNLSKNLINHLIEKKIKAIVLVPNTSDFTFENNIYLTIKKVKVRKIPFFQIIQRIFIDLIYINFLTLKHKPKKIFFFGNYCLNFSFFNIKKILLVHHPYLLNDHLLYSSPRSLKLIELLKRFIFNISIKNANVIILQTNYMKTLFLKKYPKFSKEINVLPNPLSKNFEKLSLVNFKTILKNKITNIETLKLIYISQYYPHKNHSFLVEFSSYLNEININHEIFVTLNNEDKNVVSLIKEAKLKGASLINLGKLSQKKISDVLKKIHACIYPSLSETYGNSIYECINYGVPLILPDLDYAKNITFDNLLFYKNNDVKSAYAKLLYLITNIETLSIDIFKQNYKLSSTETWVKNLLNF